MTNKETSKFKEIWGSEIAKGGFCMIPKVMLEAQKRLGLNPTQFVIIMQLLNYWWSKDTLPYPSKATIAEQVGISSRQVQRNIAALEKNGLISRITRHLSHGGVGSNEYDLTGLIDKLAVISKEINEAKKELSERKIRKNIKKVVVK